MRIVVDFQGLSEAWRDSPNERREMDLLCAIAKSGAEHEILLIFDASKRQLIRDVRELIWGVIPDDVLRIWHAPGPVAWNVAANAVRRRRAELVREAFLSSLEPDIVLVTGLFLGYRDDSVTSLSRMEYLPTAVILHEAEMDLLSASNVGEQDYQDFLDEKQNYFAVADRIFLIGSNSKTDCFSAASAALQKVRKFGNNDANPDQIAQGIMAACREFASQDQGPAIRSTSRRKRLAYISPLPPEMSGIAEYTIQLVPELARYYEIDLIVNQECIDSTSLDPSTGVHDAEWFRQNYGCFDHVLYHFGNSPIHGYMYDLLRSIPGVVVLHDFFLLDGRAVYRPDELRKTILQEHGVQQLIAATGAGSDRLEFANLPGNLSVLQNATGVIVHSDQSFQLAQEWYGPAATRDWHKVPLLRPVAEYTRSEKMAARSELGFSEDALVICSFGHIVPTKLCVSILEAIRDSRLTNDPDCKLVFVGAAEETYEKQLLAVANGLGSAQSKITGWVNSDTYRKYLLAADLAVQLRSNSRGETSASVLDCLNFGIPTIVNAHGSMRELDPDCVYRIADPVEQTALTGALEELAYDFSRRDSLGVRARKQMEERHNPQICAELYHRAIEHTGSLKRNVVHLLPEKLAAQGLEQDDIVSLAQSLSQNFSPSPRRPSLFLDVSAIAENDIHTGIQRVVRSILRALLLRTDVPYRVVPVRFTHDGEYIAAHRYVEKLMGLSLGGVPEAIIDVYRDDLFLVLDLDFRHNSIRRHAFENYQNNGARVWHVVYDLLPVRLSKYFPNHTVENFSDWLSLVASFDGAVCISRAVADDLRHWVKEHAADSKRFPEINWFHLGADIESSRPTRGLMPDSGQQLARLEKRPTFLMVGTVEPRKGHAQTLEAFEKLWKDGVDINLAIVGKKGWDVSALVRRLRNHPEHGARLFWFEDISDEYLERIYQVSTCLIVASEGEGFGLPLIEAAQHSLPILARDLPVFQEVAGKYAAYFTGLEPADLASAVQEWLTAWHDDQTVSSDQMPWLTWEQSAARLLEVILPK